MSTTLDKHLHCVWPFVYILDALNCQLVSQSWRSSLYQHIKQKKGHLEFADETPLMEVLATVKLVRRQISLLSFEVRSVWSLDYQFNELLQEIASNSFPLALSIGFHNDMGDMCMSMATGAILDALPAIPCHTLSVCYSIIYFGGDEVLKKWVRRPILENSLCRTCHDKLTSCFLLGNCSKCGLKCEHTDASPTSCRRDTCQNCSHVRSHREYAILYQCCDSCAEFQY